MKEKMEKTSLEIGDLGEGVVDEFPAKSTHTVPLDPEVELQPWSKKLLRKIDWQ